jgi:hypothetical protein
MKGEPYRNIAQARPASLNERAIKKILGGVSAARAASEGEAARNQLGASEHEIRQSRAIKGRRGRRNSNAVCVFRRGACVAHAASRGRLRSADH